MFIARRAIASIASGTQPSTAVVSKAYFTSFKQCEGARNSDAAKDKGLSMTIDGAREGAVEVAERDDEGGGSATHTVVEGAKQAIKAVLGEDEEDGPSNKSVNEDCSDSIEDLRRRAGGYDLKNR